MMDLYSEITNRMISEAVKDIIPSLHALDRMDRLYLALVIFTGMRRGEVLGLRWEDVDVSLLLQN